MMEKGQAITGRGLADIRARLEQIRAVHTKLLEDIEILERSMRNQNVRLDALAALLPPAIEADSEAIEAILTK